MIKRIKGAPPQWLASALLALIMPSTAMAIDLNAVASEMQAARGSPEVLSPEPEPLTGAPSDTASEWRYPETARELSDFAAAHLVKLASEEERRRKAICQVAYSLRGDAESSVRFCKDDQNGGEK